MVVYCEHKSWICCAEILELSKVLSFKPQNAALHDSFIATISTFLIFAFLVYLPSFSLGPFLNIKWHMIWRVYAIFTCDLFIRVSPWCSRCGWLGVETETELTSGVLKIDQNTYKVEKKVSWGQIYEIICKFDHNLGVIPFTRWIILFNF